MRVRGPKGRYSPRYCPERPFAAQVVRLQALLVYLDASLQDQLLDRLGHRRDTGFRPSIIPSIDYPDSAEPSDQPQRLLPLLPLLLWAQPLLRTLMQKRKENWGSVSDTKWVMGSSVTQRSRKNLTLSLRQTYMFVREKDDVRTQFFNAREERVIAK